MPCYPQRVPVSAREQRHFEAVRRLKEAERQERLREALARHPLESMREGLALAALTLANASDDLSDQRALGQAELARRGRERGLRTT